MTNYLFNGETHTDYSDEYMSNLGMDQEQKDFTLTMRAHKLESLHAAARERRDTKMEQALSWLQRHQHESSLNLDHKLAVTELELLSYIQALRDVPQQPGFPENITWPEAPQ